MKSKFLYIKNKEVKKSLSCKTIELPIYHCQVKLLFNKNALKLEKDWNKNRDNCGAVTRNFLKDDGSISISFFDNKPKMEDVVHEFHHATAMIMDYIGHDLSKEADEPSAYLIGYLVSEYKKL
jgi:hypothetical protein